MKYRKKPTLTEATQWFKNGDHPQDNTVPITLGDGSRGRSEGKVVQFFRMLKIPGGRLCDECGAVMHAHGLLEGLNGEEVVHPGDYVVTDRKGRYYVVRSKDFEAQYEPYAAHPPPEAT